MIGTKKINKILLQKNYDNFELDSETQIFITRTVNLHYNYVKKGLIDHRTLLEQKRKLYRSLYKFGLTGGASLLSIHVGNCVDYIGRDPNVENVYLNDIFKLQSCKDIIWPVDIFFE